MLSTMEPYTTHDDLIPAGLALRCPRCGERLTAESGPPGAPCGGCLFRLFRRHGIWLALPPERAQYYARFIADYERIRSAEGRGSHDPRYYLALPYRDLYGRNQRQWTIRAKTYACLAKRILPEIREVAGADARILDIGAGNGWLSYRLAEMGFQPVAVDLLVNDHDGLGAAKHYRDSLPTMFPRFQAESTRLPFASCQFDAVIFNASFHYAVSYTATLLESLRCLKPGGAIIVADSPWYAIKASGEQMVAERQAAFFSRFGTPSNSIPSQEFLTNESLKDLEIRLGLQWECHTPFYGVRWALRPWIARLRGRREPARFRIYTARKIA